MERFKNHSLRQRKTESKQALYWYAEAQKYKVTLYSDDPSVLNVTIHNESKETQNPKNSSSPQWTSPPNPSSPPTWLTMVATSSTSCLQARIIPVKTNQF